MTFADLWNCSFVNCDSGCPFLYLLAMKDDCLVFVEVSLLAPSITVNSVYFETEDLDHSSSLNSLHH